MTARAASIAPAAVALLLLLTGCVSHNPPPPYSDEELEDYFDTRLDAAWENTGLDGEVARPVLDGTAAERFDADNYFELSDCVLKTGLESWQWMEQENGLSFRHGSGARLSPELELAVYHCVAQFPVSDNFRNILLTPEQKRYLYDYYQSWLVPCLIGQRYDLDLSYAPDEELFVNGVGNWNPYWAIIDGPGYSSEMGLGEISRLALVRVCGDEFADLDIELPDGPTDGG